MKNRKSNYKIKFPFVELVSNKEIYFNYHVHTADKLFDYAIIGDIYKSKSWTRVHLISMWVQISLLLQKNKIIYNNFCVINKGCNSSIDDQKRMQLSIDNKNTPNSLYTNQEVEIIHFFNCDISELYWIRVDNIYLGLNQSVLNAVIFNSVNICDFD